MKWTCRSHHGVWPLLGRHLALDQVRPEQPYTRKLHGQLRHPIDGDQFAHVAMIGILLHLPVQMLCDNRL